MLSEYRIVASPWSDLPVIRSNLCMFLVWSEIHLLPIWKMSSHVMSVGFRFPPANRRSSAVSFLHKLHHRWPSFLVNRLVRLTFRPITAQWGSYLLQCRDEGEFISILPVRRGERLPRTPRLLNQRTSEPSNFIHLIPMSDSSHVVRIVRYLFTYGTDKFECRVF
jgi:hypothetical protein